MKEVQYIKINEVGTKIYFKDKELTIYHRTDGPAYEGADGYKAWYVNGKIHREDGPAIEYADGCKQWWVNNKLHREDGHAVEYGNGYKQWWISNEQLTEQQFKARTQKININGKDFTIEELNALIGAAKGK